MHETIEELLEAVFSVRCVTVSTRPEAKNDCAGEGQQQFNRPTDLLARVQLQEKKTLVMSHKSLGAKTN
jgi:hypothetical protein